MKTIIEMFLSKQMQQMKTYLPYVVILALVYWIMHQDTQLQQAYKAMDEQKIEGLKYWRDAYTKQADNYFLLIQKQQEDAQQLERNRNR